MNFFNAIMTLKAGTFKLLNNQLKAGTFKLLNNDQSEGIGTSLNSKTSSSDKLSCRYFSV